jgi:hypothetical protein
MTEAKQTERSEKRLNCKELAAALGYHPTYISAMRRAGFVMPHNRGTVSAAVEWLEMHQEFRKTNKRLG